LVGWAQKADLSDLAPLSGIADLGDGSSLLIAINVSPFTISQCPIRLYLAPFVGTISIQPAAAGVGQFDAAELLRRAQEAIGR
jgi:hypothetical protein